MTESAELKIKQAAMWKPTNFIVSVLKVEDEMSKNIFELEKFLSLFELSNIFD